MLASITPLGERGRNQRWGVTAAAFVLGSLGGGAAAGGILGWLGHAMLRGLSAGSRLPVMGLLLLTGLAVDLRPLGLRLPTTHRQVNEDWLLRYRGWAYGVGFGFQLGLGVATVVTTAAVYLTLAAALISGSAATGALVGGSFGLVRALPVLLTARVRHPDALIRLHRRLGAWNRPTSAVALAVQALLAAVAVGLWVAA